MVVSHLSNVLWRSGTGAGTGTGTGTGTRKTLNTKNITFDFDLCDETAAYSRFMPDSISTKILLDGNLKGQPYSMTFRYSIADMKPIDGLGEIVITYKRKFLDREIIQSQAPPAIRRVTLLGKPSLHLRAMANDQYKPMIKERGIEVQPPAVLQTATRTHHPPPASVKLRTLSEAQSLLVETAQAALPTLPSVQKNIVYTPCVFSRERYDFISLHMSILSHEAFIVLNVTSHRSGYLRSRLFMHS